MGPQTHAADALHAMKYREPGETFRDCCNRVAFAVSDGAAHYHEIRQIFGSQRFVPAGRIQAAMGSSKNVTAFNCFASGTVADSFVDGEGCIMDRAKEAATTMRMGGGIGYDFSTLRPKGLLIKKLQSYSSGPLSFMRVYNAVLDCVASTGDRGGAQMGVLRCDHPDIVDFVNAKHDQETLKGFNMSVAVTDEFMEAVARNSTFALRFGGETYRTVDAAQLWEGIMRSTWDWAEPGVVFLDTMNRMNNLSYCETFATTNPCVPAGTPVLTRGGWQSIEALVGSSVDVWNGERWSRVQPRITGRNEPLVKVTLSNGRVLKCTPAHQFILSSKKRVCAKELVSGSRLAKHRWPIVESGSDVADAYRRGFFVGDGWLSGERAYIGLYDKKLMLADELSTGAVSTRDYSNASGYAPREKDDRTRKYIYLGRGTDYSKDAVPGTDWSIASRLEWLAGLVDSDGCVVVCPSPSLQIGAKSKKFLLNVQLMLNTLGVSATVGKFNDCHRLCITANDLVRLNDLGLHLRRVDVSGPMPHREASRFVKIVSVELLEERADVYCFTEHDLHQGCFDGVLTGQCSEQPLPPYGACLLGSFNLVKYLSKRPGGYDFDWDQLRADVAPVVRAMDNVTDRSLFPLPQQRAEAKAKRRMGLGVMGVANTLEAMGHPYGSPGYVASQDAIMMTLANEAYRAGAALAAEKGSFPLYDEERWCAAPFVRSLDPEVQALLRKHGSRCSHYTSCAPTGTISQTCDNVSSGVEPVFSYGYDRPVKTVDGPVTYSIEDYGKKFLEVRGRRAHEVRVSEHVDVLVAAARCVDSSVSKTINCDGDTPWEEFKDIYRRAYEGGAKGCATFNKDGKRFGLLTDTDVKQPVSGAAACAYDPATGQKECA